MALLGYGFNLGFADTGGGATDEGDVIPADVAQQMLREGMDIPAGATLTDPETGAPLGAAQAAAVKAASLQKVSGSHTPTTGAGIPTGMLALGVGALAALVFLGGGRR